MVCSEAISIFGVSNSCTVLTQHSNTYTIRFHIDSCSDLEEVADNHDSVKENVPLLSEDFIEARDDSGEMYLLFYSGRLVACDGTHSRQVGSITSAINLFVSSAEVEFTRCSLLL